jgi:uncharacterized protein (DUF1501 family)
MKRRPTRREFLRDGAAISLAMQAQALAAPAKTLFREKEHPPTLVAIYLRGGADFLNMVIPHTDPTYPLVRPGIGIGESDGAIEIDKRWSLHPALAPLEPLFAEKLLLPILNVGSPHTTRSHFDAQDFMEFAAPGNRTVRTGWLNRYLSATAGDGPLGFRALAIQSLLPRSLRGGYPVLAVPSGIDGKRTAEALDRFEKFYGDGMGSGSEDGNPIAASGQVTIETLRRFREIVGGADGKEHGYPNTSFGRGLHRIAQVIEAGEGLEVAGIDYNGWDHHANQGGVSGNQARMLADLAASLAAFYRQLKAIRDHVAVLVMTEFGRTVAENGSNGTDHGHGGGMFLLGGGVKGGEIHGEWTGLKPADLYQGRDLPVTTDFRDVFSAVLRELFDFKTPRGFFPDYKPRKLKLF